MPQEWQNKGSSLAGKSPIARPKRRSRLGEVTDSWKEFLEYSKTLEEALGPNGVELLRVAIADVKKLEKELGVPGFIDFTAQFKRLTIDLLPPHFPVLRLPQGDLLIAVDSMMFDFFSRQILEEVTKLKKNTDAFSVTIQKRAFLMKEKPVSLDQLLEPFQPSPRMALPLSPTN